MASRILTRPLFAPQLASPLRRAAATQIRLAATKPYSDAPHANTIISKPGHESIINSTSADAYELLVAQRKNRPIAPHLSIYQPQLTWYSSAANRITGVTLSGLIYLYFMGYAAGLPLDSATVAASFGAFPYGVKLLTKFGLAAPFTYHSWNSCRHLVWDTGRMLDLKNYYRSGYAMLAVTAATTLWLVYV
ncbi:Similar to Succinate dehydrogenase cytochrome B subunit, mitochondrial; acc. no. O74882 [Pyronema omphalodes CBS 100304]|uniref:Similar to Succinate dehydrogenase cytochrome B subunit, mitochondrial acc. no. O74882 n=1 Tax=Pyronema omphalodes (strain CBS 100304) TaxID=1076935 RepID=U4KW52_PYROM|nr:Similar to Succinate dehydrogenase cytochrome B subunit, mitochondrial; acc. no. O74882 [Pyronema omphalodes CBS 100304]